MKIEELHKSVSEILDRINFDKLWLGFHRFDFALYDDKNVYFKDKIINVDSRFLGNTTIDYEGENIAIWHISNDQEVGDINIFTSNIVHEMFHCYQKEKNETRYSSDLILLDYPDNIENYSLKYTENIELSKGINSKESFDEFALIRIKRYNNIGKIIEQEFLVETIEGLAEYVGTMALKQISIEKYDARIYDYSNVITSISKNQFDIRRISYYIGTLFYIALNNHGYELNKDLSNKKTFFNQLIDSYSFKPDNKQRVINHKVEDAFISYVSEKRKIIDEFLLKHNNETIYKSYICGYDPMNIIKLKDMILCSNFIFLKNEGEDEPLFIKGPILLRLNHNSPNKVRSYIS